jgi:hypothetical protein
MILRADRKVEKRRYQELFALVGEVIRDWDPYELIAGGSPIDEFDSEISSVTAQVSRIKSATDAIRTISCVFSSSFEPQHFTPEACRTVGEKLFLKLQAHDVVEQNTSLRASAAALRKR